nr:MAG TPA: hypothetical protein [Caudoviricetes sp.]
MRRIAHPLGCIIPLIEIGALAVECDYPTAGVTA